MQIHEDITFTKETYEGLSIAEQKFVDCTFVGCNFGNSTFIDSEFNGCTFNNCDMSLMKLKRTNLKKIKLNSCKAIGINWSDAGNQFTIECIDSNISYATFAGKAIKKAMFKNCKAHEVDFSECSLVEANFSNTDLQDSRFVNCDLMAVDFSHATNYYIDVNLNKLKGAVFTMPEAMNLLSGLGIVVQ